MLAITKTKKYIFFCFAIIFLIIKNYHELWFDEVQAWMLVNFSTHLFKDIPLEGHPPLWYILLKLVSFFSNHIYTLILTHSVLVLTTFYFLIKITKNKTLLFFLFTNYFLFYEYGILNRHYILSLLLGCFFLYSITQNPPHRLKAYLSHTLLYFSTPFAYFIAFFTTFIFSKKNWVYLGISLFLAISLALYMLPSTDSAIYHMNFFHFSEQRVFLIFQKFFKAFFPFPTLQVSSWGTNFLDHKPLLQTFLGVFIFIWSLFFFKKKPKLLQLYFFLQITMAGFIYVKDLNEIRHYGHFFLIFLFCILYLHTYEKKINSFFLNLVLITQSLSCLYFVFLELNYPFSNASKLAKIIKKENISTVYVDNYFSTISLKTYLPQTKLIYLGTTKQVKYASYQKGYLGKVYITSLKQNLYHTALDNETTKNLGVFYLITTLDIEYMQSRFKIEPIVVLSPTIYSKENLKLYKVFAQTD